jgi:hypothetical protein
MYIPLARVNITEEDKEKIELAQWAWDSHYWVEYYPGYAECEYCKNQHASEIPITANYPLCRKNPILKKIFAKFLVGNIK